MVEPLEQNAVYSPLPLLPKVISHLFPGVLSALRVFGLVMGKADSAHSNSSDRLAVNVEGAHIDWSALTAAVDLPWKVGRHHRADSSMNHGRNELLAPSPQRIGCILPNLVVRPGRL